MQLPVSPVIYEISTWVWLADLESTTGCAVTLATVPDAVWDDIAAAGVDAVWFMGVWLRSPAGIEASRTDTGLMSSFRDALPDFRDEDNVGSPYCIRGYEVDPAIGGRAGLAAARAALAARGVAVLLDFVPNHIAPDHPWTTEHPEYAFTGTESDLDHTPRTHLRVGASVLACGRDPNFPAWPDVIQVNAFSPELRRAAAATLLSIADQCDGVRCDMAMLMLNRIFATTWAGTVGPTPEHEYWTEVLGAVRAVHPHFHMLAEAYWGTEPELIALGFDQCYDKHTYDLLARGDTVGLAAHLAMPESQHRTTVRFVENHDEPRAAATWHPDALPVVTVATALLPGAVLLYEGQRDGRRRWVPVFLRRRPDEAPDPQVRALHDALAAVLRQRPRDGAFRFLGLQDGALQWTWSTPERCWTVAVNPTDRATGTVTADPADQVLLGGTTPDGALAPWGFRVAVRPSAGPAPSVEGSR